MQDRKCKTVCFHVPLWSRRVPDEPKMGQKSNEILQSSLEIIEGNYLKDKGRQKLQEKQWDIDPYRQLSTEWTNDNHKSL